MSAKLSIVRKSNKFLEFATSATKNNRIKFSKRVRGRRPIEDTVLTRANPSRRFLKIEPFTNDWVKGCSIIYECSMSNKHTL
jgi:hypothetical protein